MQIPTERVGKDMLDMYDIHTSSAVHNRVGVLSQLIEMRVLHMATAPVARIHL